MTGFSVTKADMKKAGEWWAEGMILAASRWICLVVALIFVWTFFTGGFHDDTDAPGGHSSLTPRTDHLTGCQYLESAGGSLTPRLGADGRPICAVRP